MDYESPCWRHPRLPCALEVRWRSRRKPIVSILIVPCLLGFHALSPVEKAAVAPPIPRCFSTPHSPLSRHSNKADVVPVTHPPHPGPWNLVSCTTTSYRRLQKYVCRVLCVPPLCPSRSATAVNPTPAMLSYHCCRILSPGT